MRSVTVISDAGRLGREGHLKPWRPLLMLGTIGHRWLVAQSGTSTVPRPKASDSERMNLQ